MCVGKISCLLCVNSQIAELLSLSLISFEKAYFFRLNSSISIVNVVLNTIYKSWKLRMVLFRRQKPWDCCQFVKSYDYVAVICQTSKLEYCYTCFKK